VDVNAENLEYGIKMKDVLQQLSSKENNRTLVFLDACFSGAARQKALPSTRGVRIKPKKNSIPANTLVFASSTGRETSGIHPGQNHGMFTYYLLKKLKDTRGKINLGALEEYLKQQVPLNSTLINNQTQNPTIQYDYNLKNEWKKWKLFK